MAVEDEYKDKAAERRKSAADEDVPQSTCVIDGPMTVTVLEHNANQNLDEGEHIIKIRHDNCPPS